MKRSFEQTNFSLNITIVPSFLKFTITNFISTVDSSKPLKSEAVSVWCDIFTYIFQFKKLCDNNAILVTPNWNHFIIVDLFGGLDQHILPNVYKICNEKLANSDGELLSDLYFSYDFISKFLFMQNIFPVVDDLDTMISLTMGSIESTFVHSNKSTANNRSCIIGIALELSNMQGLIRNPEYIHLKVSIECNLFVLLSVSSTIKSGINPVRC